ncbi:BsuPI-related putative proteinase inhibitor [Lederbergia citrea]|uniref:Intracellular proteinase inhibitor BsuPI domain-containing protein n=1 Tax=Lederbergia citrea TaxID=2833581 RepID=A0A942UH32_9BACI|nr:BsuPI-related putative proteinase inhibitor [Lederbergia citrea]MBS4204095.1 hypothetical protein [Lederbergia citrea]MBS4221320.1 hypothetical protein [Lederbergia citrea]
MINFRVTVNVEKNEAKFIFTAINQTNAELVLEFSTSQIFDFIIFNSDGQIIYQFSDGMFFLQAFQYVEIPKGQEKIWKAKWNYQKGSKRVDPGEYVVEAFLIPSRINGERVKQKITASAKFHIPE